MLHTARISPTGWAFVAFCADHLHVIRTMAACKCSQKLIPASTTAAMHPALCWLACLLSPANQPGIQQASKPASQLIAEQVPSQAMTLQDLAAMHAAADLYCSTVALYRVQAQLGEHLNHQLAAVLIIRLQHRAQALHKVWGCNGSFHATATAGQGLHALQAG